MMRMSRIQVLQRTKQSHGPDVTKDKAGTVEPYMFEPEPSDDVSSLNATNEGDDDDEDAGGQIGNTEFGAQLMSA